MFYRCKWYPLFMFTTFLIDIIKLGKLKSFLEGAIFTRIVVNWFHKLNVCAILIQYKREFLLQHTLNIRLSLWYLIKIKSRLSFTYWRKTVGQTDRHHHKYRQSPVTVFATSALINAQPISVSDKSVSVGLNCIDIPKLWIGQGRSWVNLDGAHDWSTQSVCPFRGEA